MKGALKGIAREPKAVKPFRELSSVGYGLKDFEQSGLTEKPGVWLTDGYSLKHNFPDWEWGGYHETQVFVRRSLDKEENAAYGRTIETLTEYIVVCLGESDPRLQVYEAATFGGLSATGPLRFLVEHKTMKHENK